MRRSEVPDGAGTQLPRGKVEGLFPEHLTAGDPTTLVADHLAGDIHGPEADGQVTHLAPAQLLDDPQIGHLACRCRPVDVGLCHQGAAVLLVQHANDVRLTLMQVQRAGVHMGVRAAAVNRAEQPAGGLLDHRDGRAPGSAQVDRGSLAGRPEPAGRAPPEPAPPHQIVDEGSAPQHRRG